MDVIFYDGKVDTEATSNNMQHCITWGVGITEGKKGFWGSAEAFVTYFKETYYTYQNSFAYIIHSYWSLLKNKPAIICIYGSMENTPEK